MLVQPGGKILVAGSARQGQNRFAPIQGAIARFNGNGSLDSGFGAGGKVLTAGNGPLPRWAWTRRGTSSSSRPWPNSARCVQAVVQAYESGLITPERQ